MAGSSGVNLVLGLARTKIQAMAWGPAGVGAIGLLQAAMSTASIVGGLGVDAAATRELASAEDAPSRSLTRDASLWGMMILGFAGALASGLAFSVLGSSLGFHSTAQAALVAVGVLLTVVATNQRATLSGLRRVRTIALVGILGSILSTALLSLLTLLPVGELVLALAILAIPLTQATCFGGALLRIPRIAPWPGWRAVVGRALSMSKTAGVMAVAGILPVVAQLAIRSVAHGALDDSSFGCFQAGLSLSAVTVSVLAGSVGPSVYPRLSALSSDRGRLQEAMDWQIGVYLMLYAPIIFTVEAAPDLVVRALFAPSFADTAGQVRWQLVGEVLRLPSWVMAAALTARGRFRGYLWTEGINLVASVALVSLAAQSRSLDLLGVALALASLAQFITLWAMLRADGIHVSARTLAQVAGVAAAAALAGIAVATHAGARYAVAAVAAGAAVMAVRSVVALRKLASG